MMTLYGFGPAFGLPDPSPFVTKAELLLKWAQVPYQVNCRGFLKAPKGKLPYIEDQQVRVPDSTFIRWHIEKKYGIDFDAGLSEADRSIAWSVEKMLEDHLYWAMLYYRWCDEDNYQKGPAQFFRNIPWPIRGLVERHVRRKMRAYLQAQGMGRHTEQEIQALAAKGFSSLAALLGNKRYLMGDLRCGADATLAAFIAGALCPRFASPIRSLAEQHANLVAYSARMMQENFPELAKA